ncbi:MAG TPA: hypothetical protein VF743_01455 [Acidimicrobiales bacterium]
MSSILDTVTEAETRVVETVRNLRGPVVEYVRKGVAFADSRLPEVTYPETLPSPTAVVDSQYDFLKSLLDAQHDLVKAVVEAVAPLAGAESAPAPRTKAAKASKATV